MSSVHIKGDEDLVLDLHISEPVTVIYYHKDSYDGHISTVVQHLLWCKDEYKQRASLNYQKLVLTGVNTSDSGVYTIRDTENNEDRHVYTVSVEEREQENGLPVWTVGLVLVMVLVVVGALLVKFLPLKKQLWKHSSDSNQRLKDQAKRTDETDMPMQRNNGGAERGQNSMNMNGNTVEEELEERVEETDVVLSRMVVRRG